MANAVEEHGERDADEFIAGQLLSLDFFTRMRADVRRVDGKALTTIGAEATAGLPRTWWNAHALHMAISWSAHAKRPLAWQMSGVAATNTFRSLGQPRRRFGLSARNLI